MSIVSPFDDAENPIVSPFDDVEEPSGKPFKDYSVKAVSKPTTPTKLRPRGDIEPTMWSAHGEGAKRAEIIKRINEEEKSGKRLTRQVLKGAGGALGGIVATPETLGTGTAFGAMLGYGAGKHIGNLAMGEDPRDEFKQLPPLVQAPVRGSNVLESAYLGLRNYPQVAESAGTFMEFPTQMSNELLAKPITTGNWEAAGETAKSLPTEAVKFFARPTGALDAYNMLTGKQQGFGLPEMQRSWEEDVVGSLAAVTGAGKMGAKTLDVAKEMPGKISDAITRPVDYGDYVKKISYYSSKFAPLAKKVLGDTKYREKAQQTAANAIENIYKLRDEIELPDSTGAGTTGLLPKNQFQLMSAVEQAKNKLFNWYDSIASAAQDGGIKVSTDNVKSILNEIITNSKNKYTKAQIRAAKSVLGDFDGDFSPRAAQSRIADLNERLAEHYRSPNPKYTNKAKIEKQVLDQFRQDLISSVSNAGEAYAPFRKAFGSVAELENNLMRSIADRLAKEQKKSLEGLDVLAIEQIAYAIAKQKPAYLLTAATTYGTKNLMKFMKDPDRAVDNAFRSAKQQFKYETLEKPEIKKIEKSFNPEEVPARTGDLGDVIGDKVAPTVGLEEGGIPSSRLTNQRVENPEISPIQGSGLGEVVPKTSGTRGLEEGGNLPDIITRPKTVENPEVNPNSIPNAGDVVGNRVRPTVGIEEGGIPPESMSRPKVENPERLPGQQSSFSPEETVSQGNTDIDVLSMAKRLKELGFTDEQISQFVPKPMTSQKWNEPNMVDPIKNTTTLREGVTGIFNMLSEQVAKEGGGMKGVAKVAAKVGVPAALIAKFLSGSDEDRKKMLPLFKGVTNARQDN